MVSTPPAFAAVLLLATSFQGVSLDSPPPITVHEWGTFTSLQDDRGDAIGGINVDDEPVPNFVANVGTASPAAQYSWFKGNFGLPPYLDDKAWAAGDPAVTMRLETPVIYIYPPKGQASSSVPPLNLHVEFHGGVLSQFYPWAQVTGLPLINDTPYSRGMITGETTTGLTWKDVRLGSTGQPIATDDKVWTTPREVAAPLLEITTHFKDAQGVEQKAQNTTETEHFLFYRGVGHLDSPLRIGTRVGTLFRGLTGTPLPFGIQSQAGNENLIYSQSWFVQIRANGSCAFRAMGRLQTHSKLSLGTTLSFYDQDFSVANLEALKASMQDALIKEGLYPDEASAMLRTWELSYFKSPGLRFFYIVPRLWVDTVLPLRITGAPAKITRVMIGRIELITDAQQAALARLAAGPCPDLPAFKKSAFEALKNRESDPSTRAYYRGEKPLVDLGIPIPPLIVDYLSLGRFRDALIVHENLRHPTSSLGQFISQNRLTAAAASNTTSASNSLNSQRE